MCRAEVSVGCLVMWQPSLGEPVVHGVVTDFGEFPVDRQVVPGQSRGIASLGLLHGASAQRQHCANPRVNIVVAECLVQGSESHLPGAMAGSDVFDLPGVVQRSGDLGDHVVRSNHQMKTAGDQMDFLVDLARLGDDVLDSRVRAADDKDDAVRGVDSQR